MRQRTTTGALRTRLKVVFQKTGTNRQVDLVRLILVTPAGPPSVLD